MHPAKRSLLEVHLAVALFGLSGLFGKFLTIPSETIVLGRTFFSSSFLVLFILCSKRSFKVKSHNHFLCLIIMGIILAIHWCTFFKAIQLSTVAIGLLTFSTFPIFITFIEPFIWKDRINLSDVLAAVAAFIGIVFVVPQFDLGNTLTQGALWGIASGFSYAILSMFNKKFVSEYSGVVLAFYEQFIAALVLVPFVFFQRPIVSNMDVVFLIILGVVFTGVSHSLFINSLKRIKTHTAGIISCLEPVYGIFFAAVILREMLSFREMVGSLIVLSTVLYTTIKANKHVDMSDLSNPE